MAIIALASASGSPGVSTTCLGLAMVWPRPVLLVEADPTGGAGVLAGYFRGQRDAAGVVELVMANRQRTLAAALPTMLVDLPGTQARVLVGTKAHEQAAGLALLWDDLVPVLQDLSHRTGQDIIVDIGRLGLDGWARPLFSAADVALLLVRDTLPSLAALRSWAATLGDDGPGHAVRVVTTGPRRTYSDADISATMGVPVLASIAWQPDAARVLSDGTAHPSTGPFGWRTGERGFAQGPVMRSITALGERARALCTTDPEPTVVGLDSSDPTGADR